MVTTVSDLDALVLRCRSKRARSYIGEAVVCLKAGAYRAAIVVTWIAVVHDLIEKFDELALGGEKNARSKVEAFRRSVEAHDIAASLAFERAILEIAHKEFEVAALFYSLIESAKLVGVDPVKYLRAAVEASLREQRALLPHEFRATTV